jgi:hypothetical protein
MDYSNLDRKVPATKKRPSRSTKKRVVYFDKSNLELETNEDSDEASKKRRATALSFVREVSGNVSISAALMEIFIMSQDSVDLEKPTAAEFAIIWDAMKKMHVPSVIEGSADARPRREPSKATPLPPRADASAVSGPTPRRCPPLPAPPPASAQRSPSLAVANASAARPQCEPSKATPLPPPPAGVAAAPPPPPEHLGCCALIIFCVEIGQRGQTKRGVGIFFLIMELIRLYVCSVKRFSCFSQNKCTILNS